MRTNRWFLTVGLAAMIVTGWTSVASASSCTSSSDCPDSAPICAGSVLGSAGVCKPCTAGLTGLLSCSLSAHESFTCSNGSCVDPNATATSSSSSSSSSSGATTSSSSSSGLLGGLLGSSSSSSSSSGSSNIICASDAECGGTNSGSICNSATHACTAGCRVGSNGCAADLVCTGLVGDVGVCLVPSSTPATPATNASCTTDTDCGELLSGTICSDGKCTPGCRVLGGNTCPIDLDCLTTVVDLGICVLPSTSPSGCKTDSDCGGVNSGEVCDTLSGSCLPGCRITGGNDCPLGLTCDLSFDTFGLCILPGSDAGSSGSSGTTKVDAGQIAYPESRNPISTGGTGTGDGGASVAAGADLDVQGGGCNVSNNDMNGGAGIAGLIFGAAVLVSRRRRAA